ncbi:MAG: hypothetical protein FD180_765 [Planctomycetota bacterium]|nr:MAG: hypothetical protein FD180_765 [Planctomycetota bacterium]
MTRAQFQTVAFCAPALVAGVALGFFISPLLRAQTAPPVPGRTPAGQASAREPEPVEHEALRREIAGFEHDLAKRTARPAEAEDQQKRLLARIPGLQASGDSEGLLALMQELAALGEPGYAAALEIAAFFESAGKSPLAIWPNDPKFRLIFNPAMLDLSAWALRHPHGVPDSFLQRALVALEECGERDFAGPLLEFLSTCETGEVSRKACDRLERIAYPSSAPAIAAALRSQAKLGHSTWDLCCILARLGSEGALRELEELAKSQDPIASADARDALAVVRPPAGREAVTASGNRSGSRYPNGVEWGDVAVSFAGTTLTSLDQLDDLYKAAPQNIPQVLIVERRGKPRRITLVFEANVTTWTWEDD